MTMKMQLRNGGEGGLPPSPPLPRPAEPSHSAAQRAAYTEAHQSSHTLQSLYTHTNRHTHTHRDTHRREGSTDPVRNRLSEAGSGRD